MARFQTVSCLNFNIHDLVQNQVMDFFVEKTISILEKLILKTFFFTKY